MHVINRIQCITIELVEVSERKKPIALLATLHSVKVSKIALGPNQVLLIS